MEEIENKNKAIQYWNHVYDAGVVLFSNPSCQRETLKSLIDTVLNTKLLCEIECLSGEEVNESFPFPLTAWLLEGIYGAAVSCVDDVASEEFYIESQIKLLAATYDRSVYEYVELIKLYMSMINTVCEARNTSFKFLMKGNVKLDKKTITPVSFTLSSEMQRLRFLRVLLRVLHGTSEILFNCCSLEGQSKINSLQGMLWNKVAVLVDLGNPEIIVMLLPIINSMICTLLFKKYNGVLLDIFCSLPSVLSSSSIIYPSRKQEIVNIWQTLKNSLTISSLQLKHVMHSLLQVKNTCRLENFVAAELGDLIPRLIDSKDVETFLEDCDLWPFCDKVILLEGIIVMSLKSFTKSLKGKDFCSEVSDIDVRNISSHWNEMMPSILEIATNGVVNYGRIKSMHVVLTVVTHILGRLDEEKLLWQNNISLTFFGKNIDLILRCVVDHVMEPRQGEISEIAAEALSFILNIPEIKDVPPGDLINPVSNVISLLSNKSERDDIFEICPIKVKLLQSLQSIPPGLTSPCSLSIFASVIANLSSEDESYIQVIRSVPILYLIGKKSPSQLIADILLPAMLSGKDDIQIAVINAASSLVCCVAGTARVLRLKTGNNSIECYKCLEPATVKKSKDNLTHIESHITKLLEPVFSASVPVRRCFLVALPKLTLHMRYLRSANNLPKLMAFLSDPDAGVRKDFAYVVTTVIFGCSSDGQEDELISPCPTVYALDLFFKTLEQAINNQLTAEQWGEGLQILLSTLNNVACFPSRAVLLQSLKMMLLFVGNCPLPLSSMASSVAAAHKTSSLALYYSFKPELSQFFGQLLVENQVRFGCPPALTLSSIILFFNGLSKVRFASGSEQYMLPFLVAAMVKQEGLKKILADYAEYVSLALPVVFTRSFQNIYVYIWLNETEEVFKECMKMMEQTINVKVPDLIMHCQKMIIHQFLFNYHLDEEKVLQGLRQVLNLGHNNVKEQIASNLESRFVGFLLFLVGKFTKEGSAESEKVQALESLSSVLRLMGMRRVTPVSRKILATLQTTLTLNNSEHHALQCKAWSAFVRTVKSKEIGPLLATIVVSLLKFLDHAEAAVVELLTYLLVEQRVAVEDYLPSITFLPEHPALSEINRSIRSYVSFENENIKERLTRETTLALHETVGVRVEGLKALLKTLQTMSQDVEKLINGSDEPDPCITAVWEVLVTCCRDAEPNISLTAAVCLGELGAVDPGLLPRKLKPRDMLPLSVHDPEFGYLALCEIVRGFQNARTSVDMDAFAIAIQELLKIYSVTEADDNKTWSRFSSGDQSLLRPMLTSRYKVQAPARTSWPEIIFGTREASSHMRWAALWAGKLVSRCSDSRAVVLFRACEPSMKRDPKVLLFFLQYITLIILTQDSQEHGDILKEMDAVLSWSPSDAQPHSTSIPVRLIESCGYPLIRSSMSDVDARACAMTVFLLLDFLHYWSRYYLVKNFTQTADHLRKKDYTFVKGFLAKIELAKMASHNFEMQEYPRAIQCWEDLVQTKPDSFLEHLPMLSKAYARYGDLDSVGGAMALQGSAPDVEDQLFYHQVSRQMEEVRILYEQLGKSGSMALSEVEGMVLCYLRLGEPSTAYSHIQKNIQDPPEMALILTEGLSECLIKLGDWNGLDSFLKSEIGTGERSWYTQLGRITLGLEKDNLTDFNTSVSQARTVLVDNFTALGMQSGNEYQGYHCLVKLQILNEIEKVRDVAAMTQEPANLRFSLQNLFKHWEAKTSLVQSDNECLEHILSTRRTLLTVLSRKVPEETKQLIHDELGKCWVKSAEIARKAGCFHQAYNYILSAEPYNIPLTFIQKAQLLWEKGDQEGSLATLTRGIASHFPDAETMKTLPADERLEERKMTAEAKLLYAVYNEETSNCSSYTNMSNYQDAFDVCRQLEKTQVLLAQCLDRGLSLIDEREQGESKACDLRVMMVSNFGKSLLNGCEYIYQTVPRMLTIWLDLGENLSTTEKTRAMTKINKLIQIFADKLPPFILMTALPQLLSRIGHPNREVFLLLKAILVKLILAFPQQCLWAIQTLAKSSVPERSMRYKDVIQDPALRSSPVFKLIEDFTSLCDKLNRLTNKILPQDSITRGLMVSSVVRELPLLLNSERFSRVIVPITKFCAISLPKSVTSATHQPFSNKPVTIAGIKNEMTVLPSLQRPRKITFLGSDGKPYDILCKPKDDLRRDARLMEFNNIVNMYLHRDPESRARHLHIRTYVVIPLGESGGLLEWVPNLVGLRPALLQIYKQHGKFVSTRELRKHELQARDPLEKKKTVFLEKLIPMHPPLFYEWFRLTFPDPAGWYAARQSFTRTTAVMSMVGYILGLGDRHGENILFDSESGETVHVDFNCLFNKGENFDWKERVPFRLTHNMAVAMGPCGVEGTFRKCCEISMRVLRAQGKTLMSVLTPFAYDPFGSWSKNKEIIHQERDQKIAEALEELNDIEKRLNGSLRVKQKNNTFYLSVEGLVRSLITEATSVDNLCQMYLGWGAYL